MRLRTSKALCAGALVVTLTALVAPAAASVGRQFSQPVHVDVADKTGEPSIAVARDGTEYIVAPDGPGVRLPSTLSGAGTGGSLVWRSDDHGRTWIALGSYDVPTGGGDTDIAIAPDGTLYASGLSYLACSTIARSTDKGASWLPMPVAGCGRQPLFNDRQWTALAGGSTVYTAIGDTTSSQIDLIRSSVTSPLVIPSSTIQLSRTADYQWPGTIAVNQRTGTAYTVWNTVGRPNNCDHSESASKCRPEAASTKKPDRILLSALPAGASEAPAPLVVARRGFDTFDSFVATTLDRAGRLYVVWSERHPGSRSTWTVLSRSADGGHTWSKPVKVEQSPRTTTFPWVTAGDKGRIAVSYYGTRAGGNSPQTVAKTAEWKVFSAFSTDGGRTFQEYKTTGVMHRGPICTSGTGCTSGGRNLLDFFETAADPNGCLVTAFADNAVDPKAGAVVSYVRQTAGPGLLAGHACKVPG